MSDRKLQDVRTQVGDTLGALFGNFWRTSGGLRGHFGDTLGTLGDILVAISMQVGALGVFRARELEFLGPGGSRGTAPGAVPGGKKCGK